jgi:ABC-type transport system involved in Fe-S cluster assembly fused permease/ATPase subunit
MKNLFKILAILLCFVFMAAHWSRAGMSELSILCLLFPFILLWRHRIAAIVTQIVLFLFGLEWIRALLAYVNIRIENQEDWLRLAVILVAVSLINFATILVFRTASMKARYKLK